MKTCCTCKIEKEDDKFTPSQLQNTNSKCKDCCSEYNKQRRENAPIKEQATCRTCLLEKEAIHFSPSQLKVSNGECKKCSSEYNKQRKESRPEKIKATCRTCLIEKEAIDFPPSELKNKNSQCRNCHSIHSKQRRQENPEENKNYRRKNKEKINLRRRQRYQNEPVYKIRTLISNIVYQALQLQGFSKNGESCAIFFPWTIEELISHIESLFEPWMHWRNHGKYNKDTWVDANVLTHFWQLDHIIPQSDLPYESMEDENFKKCWALSNLRPLSAKQNIIDGARKTHL